MESGRTIIEWHSPNGAQWRVVELSTGQVTQWKNPQAGWEAQHIFRPNMDQIIRDSIVTEASFKAHDAARFEGSADNLRHFSNLFAYQLRGLLEEGFIDPLETQNGSPTVAEFLAFMERWPQVTCHGYAVGTERSDYRVTIEGLDCMHDITDDLFEAFKGFLDGASCGAGEEIAVRPGRWDRGRLYCWWD